MDLRAKGMQHLLSVGFQHPLFQPHAEAVVPKPYSIRSHSLGRKKSGEGRSYICLGPARLSPCRGWNEVRAQALELANVFKSLSLEKNLSLFEEVQVTTENSVLPLILSFDIKKSNELLCLHCSGT